MVALLFVTVLVSGLLAVDLNKSYIFYGEQRLELFRIETIEQDVYRLFILNEKFDLNLKFIKRDFNNFMELFR